MGDDAKLLEFQNRLIGAIRAGALQDIRDVLSADEAPQALLRKSDPQSTFSIGAQALIQCMLCPHFFVSPSSSREAMLAILEIVGPHFPATESDAGVLITAVDTQNVELVRTLLQLPHIDVNMPWRVHAMIAAADSLEMTQLLLQCKNVDVNVVDRQSWTPLMWACHAGNTEVVEALLACPHLNVDIQSSKPHRPGKTLFLAGVTALDIAERLDHVSIVERLREQKMLTITSKRDEGDVIEVTCATVAGEAISVSVPALATVGDLRSHLGDALGVAGWQVKLLVGSSPLCADSATLNLISV
eukprot:TRINITY_DN1881_c0_g1_i1.p1 TRINITY_DN1881_c0_g1~~TRINITY_DN1881_c0_g1_i1.p1  ORF type:complete len:301 (-),score=51.86 TRINITY_DN1881_c0_g1_i1:6-908(-)